MSDNPEFESLREKILSSTVKKWSKSMSQDEFDELEDELPEIVAHKKVSKKVLSLVDLLFREGLQPLNKERKPAMDTFEAALTKVDDHFHLYMKQEIEMMQIMLFSTIDDLNAFPYEALREHAKEALATGDMNTHKWTRVRMTCKSDVLHNLHIEDGKRFAEIIIQINV